jgi:16S rRNA (uracil1498-N3)-methyltransferase
VTQVLRLHRGDALCLFNGDGRDYAATLSSAGRQGATARLTAAGEPEPASTLRTHLWFGISKGERMDYALQKAVELGVTSLTPVQTVRTVVRLQGDRMERRLAHWRGVMINACEQSGRSTLPQLRAPLTLPDLLADRPRNGLLLDPRAARSLPDLEPPGGGVTLLIGPEGGLTPEERSAALATGFTAIRLGPRVLRAETAPLAALAAMQVLWGDFR